MDTKAPVVIVVFVETNQFRWFVGAIDMQGQALPLVSSEAGDLSSYVDQSFDEQASFLRHRLCGALQKGCDRLWARQLKPRQVVIVVEGTLDRGPEKLTERVAEHLVEWLTNPPVAFFSSADAERTNPRTQLRPLAGEVKPEYGGLLESSLDTLLALTSDATHWEISRRKPATADSG